MIGINNNSKTVTGMTINVIKKDDGKKVVSKNLYQ